MNKLASIYFLQGLGLPTIWPNLITSKKVKGIKEIVNSFYYPHGPGWVLRCGEPPEKEGKVERNLPWDVAHCKEELIIKITSFQEDVGSQYLVFCHPSYEMVRGGIMLVEGSGVTVESAVGNPKELSAFYRGYRSPEQQIIFKPGMLSQKRYGGDVLNNSDLLDLRNIERMLNWSELDAVSVPTCVEFSWLKNGSFYVHDLSAVN